MTTRPARVCAYCDDVEGDLLRALARQEVLERCCSGLEGELLRAKTRAEAFRLRVQRVVEKMAAEVAQSVVDGEAPVYPVGPVEHYRDLLVQAMGEDAVDKP